MGSGSQCVLARHTLGVQPHLSGLLQCQPTIPYTVLMTEAWDTSSIPGGEALLGTPVLCELGQCLLQITPFFKKV